MADDNKTQGTDFLGGDGGTGANVNEANSAAEAGRAAEAQESSAYSKYVKSVKAFEDGVKKTQESVKKAQQDAQSQNADEVANSTMEKTGGEPISFSEALAMVDNEKAANKALRQTEMTALKDTATDLGSVVLEGGKVLWNQAKDTGRGILDTIKSPQGLGTLAVGGALGAMFENTDLVSGVSENLLKILSGNKALEEGNETEADEKYIGGYDPENLEQSAYEDALGETGQTSYDDETMQGETAEGKDIENDGYIAHHDSNDALNSSEEDLENLSHLNQEDADTSWLDTIGKLMEDYDKEDGSMSLIGAIGQGLQEVTLGDGAGALGTVAEVVKQTTSAMDRLNAAAAETDRNEAEKQEQDDGPGYGKP